MKKLLLSVLLGISLTILISHCGMNSNVSSPHRRMGDELEIAERMFKIAAPIQHCGLRCKYTDYQQGKK